MPPIRRQSIVRSCRVPMLAAAAKNSIADIERKGEHARQKGIILSAAKEVMQLEKAKKDLENRKKRREERAKRRAGEL